MFKEMKSNGCKVDTKMGLLLFEELNYDGDGLVFIPLKRRGYLMIICVYSPLFIQFNHFRNISFRIPRKPIT